MAFPYPEKPSEWQTAYTREQAHLDSERRETSLDLVVLATIPIISLLALYLFRNEGIRRNIDTIREWLLVILGFFLVALIIFIVIKSIALRLSGNFLREFYQPPEYVYPLKLIQYRLSGVPRLPPPLSALWRFSSVTAKEGKIDKPDEWPAWMTQNMGGPIVLVVFDGCALYLERGNRFSRVIGPSEKLPFLELYETIKEVVDIRPISDDKSMKAWTQDGINIEVKVHIECRIGDPAKSSEGLVYPFDPEAVKKAVERTSVRMPDGKTLVEMNGVDLVWGQVTSLVVDYIGSRKLDALLLVELDAGPILSEDATENLLQTLNQKTQEFGFYVTNLQITHIEPPPDIEEQRKQNLKAEMQSLATIIDGQARASSIRVVEKVRADAQRDMILAIAEGLDKDKTRQFTETLLLSLYGILDESLEDPLVRPMLAQENLEALERLKSFLEGGNAT